MRLFARDVDRPDTDLITDVMKSQCACLRETLTDSNTGTAFDRQSLNAPVCARR